MNRLFRAKTFFILCGLFIFYATTIPWDAAHAPSLTGVSWIPGWDSARGRIWSIPDMVQNVVLFMPFGFFGALGLGWAARRGVVITALLTGATGLSLSLLVEALQTMSATRSPSTTDLATNLIGAAIGGGTAAIYVRHLERRVLETIHRTAARQPGLLILSLYFDAIVVGSLAPFIPTLDVGLLRANARQFLDNPWGPKPFGALITDGLLFGALAFLIVRELPPYLGSKKWSPLFRKRPISPGAAGLFGLLLASALALGLEAGQMIVIGHSPGLQDAAVGILCSAVGALLAAALAGGDVRPATSLGQLTRERTALVLGFAIFAPFCRAMQPFQFQPLSVAFAELSVWSFVPFWALFKNLNLSTFRNVFEAAAIYLPLGYALRALGWRAAAGFVACLGLGELLEVFQLPVVGRVFDVTEGLYAGLMGLVGAWVLTSLGASEPPGEDDTQPLPAIRR